MSGDDDMTMDEKIKRINELYHLSQERELTPNEKEEQMFLRKAYIDSVRANLRGQLENIEIVEKDGSRTPVKRKNEK